MCDKERAMVLAGEILRQITVDPSSYNQENWAEVPMSTIDGDWYDDTSTTVSCPTTGCIAGWASLLHGDSFVLSGARPHWHADDPATLLLENVLNSDTGKIEPVFKRAAKLLCLEVEGHMSDEGADGDWLFSSDRRLEEVRYALMEIARGKPISRKYTRRLDVAGANFLSRDDMEEVDDFMRQLLSKPVPVEYQSVLDEMYRHHEVEV